MRKIALNILIAFLTLCFLNFGSIADDSSNETELNFFAGNLVGCTILTEDGSPKNVISVHSPAWPVNKDRLANVDVSDVKLKYNPDVWCTEILWAALKHTMADSSRQWIGGGDFNSSETFDYLWKMGLVGATEKF